MQTSMRAVREKWREWSRDAEKRTEVWDVKRDTWGNHTLWSSVTAQAYSFNVGLYWHISNKTERCWFCIFTGAQCILTHTKDVTFFFLLHFTTFQVLKFHQAVNVEPSSHNKPKKVFPGAVFPSGAYRQITLSFWRASRHIKCVKLKMIILVEFKVPPLSAHCYIFLSPQPEDRIWLVVCAAVLLVIGSLSAMCCGILTPVEKEGEECVNVTASVRKRRVGAGCTFDCVCLL